jgi:tol-pal system protein YbgF
MKGRIVIIMSVILSTLLVFGCSGSKNLTDEVAHEKIDALSKEVEQVKGQVETLSESQGANVTRGDLETIIKEIKKLNSEIEALNVRQNRVIEDMKALKNKEMNFQKSAEFIDSTSYTLFNDIQFLKNKIAELNEKLNNLHSGSAVAASPAGLHPERRKPEVFKADYVEALGAFQNKRYDEAIKKFKDLLKTNPDHELADNAQYWLAESYYMKGDFQRALIEFEKVFTFTEKGKYDDAQLKLGYCYLKLGQNDQAKAEFERLVKHYPYSEYYQQAQKMVNQLK